MWLPMLNRVKTKLVGWKSKLLTCQTLLCKIIMMLFTCSIECLYIEEAQEIDKRRQFLWGELDGKKNESICKLIVCGLGITNLMLKNKALLNKWVWRYGSKIENLWKQVMAEINGKNLFELMSRFLRWSWPDLPNPHTNSGHTTTLNMNSVSLHFALTRT
ncbi:Uncharacterized protein TCM_013899 [Theobroma cacao]|uniref:Reverse transcriptase zinc-binding domain-containing protein n=1 Tax=Theobroma cacao TaxID=3641 RepID=A0A061FY36_THECC|nr:Uncharacterized protein TCM_013899 [Theobroma cacao]